MYGLGKGHAPNIRGVVNRFWHRVILVRGWGGRVCVCHSQTVNVMLQELSNCSFISPLAILRFFHSELHPNRYRIKLENEFWYGRYRSRCTSPPAYMSLVLFFWGLCDIASNINMTVGPSIAVPVAIMSCCISSRRLHPLCSAVRQTWSVRTVLVESH